MKYGHDFLPLPPYSSKWSPIEQFGVSLKNKVTEWTQPFLVNRGMVDML